MNKVQLEITEHQDGIDFLIKNFDDLGILTIQKLKEFALKRNGYFRDELKQFGIKRKFNEKQLYQIFELLELNITIMKSLQIEIDTSITDLIVNFGKYKGWKWSNVPLNYLQWIYEQNENKFADEEIKRRKNIPINIDNEIIQMGMHKGQKWIDVPLDYLEWLLTQFDEKHDYHKYANLALNQKIQ